jgi:hypothetical protein
MSICGSAPFTGAGDQTLAVAYVAVFILVFIVRTRKLHFTAYSSNIQLSGNPFPYGWRPFGQVGLSGT